MKHRLLVLSLVVAATVLIPGLIPGPAQAAACSGSTGVTVVVDYDDGRVQVGCAPGDPSSGYQALTSAGFSITLATGNGAGALCSINKVPNHPCPSMPPADAYWAYFHAERGGSWKYSNVGAGGYDPKPGSVEGWHFRGNAGDPPAVAPPAAPSTPKPTPAPSPKPSPKPSPGPNPGPNSGPKPGTQTSATSGAQPGAASPQPSGDGTAAPGTTSPTPSAGPASAAESPSTAPSADAVTVTDATTPLAESEDGGGASWVWGVAIVVVLGAAAGAALLRRRRA